MSEWIIEAGDADFETQVVARSASVPVVVDFWAPWCGPCQTLGPLLEKLADEYAGAFILATVNVDTSPAISQALRVQSIPTILGVRDGRVVVRAVGALAETELRAFLDKVMPSAAEVAAKAADSLRAEGKIAEAEAEYARALDLEPRNGLALLGLAQLLFARKDDAAALDHLERILPGPQRDAADRLAAEIRLRAGGEFDEAALRRRLVDDPGDLDACFELGEKLAAVGRYEDALKEWLELLRRDRDYRDGAARKAILDVFEVMGPTSDVVSDYRAELAKVLFR